MLLSLLNDRGEGVGIDSRGEGGAFSLLVLLSLLNDRGEGMGIDSRVGGGVGLLVLLLLLLLNGRGRGIGTREVLFFNETREEFFC